MQAEEADMDMISVPEDVEQAAGLSMSRSATRASVFRSIATAGLLVRPCSKILQALELVRRLAVKARAHVCEPQAGSSTRTT